jgi:hypothetical protein
MHDEEEYPEDSPKDYGIDDSEEYPEGSPEDNRMDSSEIDRTPVADLPDRYNLVVHQKNFAGFQLKTQNSKLKTLTQLNSAKLAW